jgi:hypothetical protein
MKFFHNPGTKDLRVDSPLRPWMQDAQQEYRPRSLERENKRPCKKDFAKENVTDQWCTSNGGDELELSKNLAPLGEMRNRVATTI